jgi:outer membrane protein assembly factor BamB
MRKILFPLLLIGVMLVLSCKKKNKDDDPNNPDGSGGSSTKIELAVSPWPCYGQNPRLSFSSPYNGPSAQPTEKWKVNINKSVMNHSMIIGSDGTIYVNGKRSLIAVRPEDGSVKWSYDAKMDLSEAAIIDKNNIIYVTGIEYGSLLNTYGNVIAIKADSGTLKWKFNSKDSVSGGYTSSPNIGYEEYLYAAENNTKKLYALNYKGEKAWEFASPYMIIGMPAVGNDSIIYFSSYQAADGNGSLIAVRPGGTQKWRVDFNSGSPATSPAIGIPVLTHGYIYVSYGGRLYCYKKDGKSDWDLPIQSGNAGTRISVSNETVYFHDNSGNNTYLISMKNSAPVFSLVLPYNTTIENDGNIYITGTTSIVFFNTSTQTTSWTYSLGTNSAELSTAYAVIDKNGVMYIATDQGNLIALH